MEPGSVLLSKWCGTGFSSWLHHSDRPEADGEVHEHTVGAPTPGKLRRSGYGQLVAALSGSTRPAPNCCWKLPDPGLRLVFAVFINRVRTFSAVQVELAARSSAAAADT